MKTNSLDGIIWVVHGAFSTGKKWDALVNAFKDGGYRSNDLDYGRRYVSVWFASRVAAQSLKSVAEPGDVAIGFSNGCNVVNKACWLGAPFSQVAYIAPALNRDTDLAPHIRRALVFCTKNDWAVRIARWLPFSPWGDMGAAGYTGNDSRYEVVRDDSIGGHTEWLTDPETLAARIAAKLEE